MKNVLLIIAAIIVAVVLYIVATSGSRSGAEDSEAKYNSKTDLTIGGVPFDKAKNDATADTPPPPPVIKR